MSGATIIKCKNCNRELKAGEREIAEKAGTSECADCSFHRMNGTNTIEKYNAWLRHGREGEQCSSQH